MARKDVQSIEWTCDSCGKVTLVDPDEVYADGYHGTVHEVASWGGDGNVEWYACSQKCVKQAVVRALEREREAT